jgi:hypothetical protein
MMEEVVQEVSTNMDPIVEASIANFFVTAYQSY